MAMKNTDNSYGLITIFLHWLMFVLVVGMLTVGVIMEDMPLGPDKLELYWWHKSFGVTILFLVALRLLWRITNITPKLPDDMNKIQRFLAHSSHFMLYVFLFAMPITGWLMSSYAGFPVPFFEFFKMPDLVSPNKENMELFVQIHEWLAYGLFALIILHLSAALYHHFVLKDNILRRMLGTK